MTGSLQTLLIVFILLLTSLTGYAAIYKYRDKDGRLNFVDDQNKIPAEYRDRSKTIRETADALGNFDSPTSEHAVDAPADLPATTHGPSHTQLWTPALGHECTGAEIEQARWRVAGSKRSSIACSDRGAGFPQATIATGSTD